MHIVEQAAALFRVQTSSMPRASEFNDLIKVSFWKVDFSTGAWYYKHCPVHPFASRSVPISSSSPLSVSSLSRLPPSSSLSLSLSPPPPPVRLVASLSARGDDSDREREGGSVQESRSKSMVWIVFVATSTCRNTFSFWSVL